MFTYPPAPRHDVVDNYHGNAIADPYRWLEDPDSAETRKFVEEQTALSHNYLSGLPHRQHLFDSMQAAWDSPRTFCPTRRGDVTVWSYNPGADNQPTYLVQHGSDEPQTLLEPVELSADGTVAVNGWALSPDGGVFAYSVADAGSDWQIIRFRDTHTGADLPDELHFVKFTLIVWHEDGVFYSRFPEVNQHSVETVNNPSLHYHRLGTDQADDPVWHNNAAEPDLMYAATVTHDGTHLVMSEYEGTSRHNGLLYREIGDDTPWIRLAERLEATHEFLVHLDGRLICRTDRDAPNGRIVAIPMDGGEAEVVVAEQEAPIETALATGGHLVLVRVIDGAHRLERYTLDGAMVGVIDLPEFPTVSAMSGRYADDDLFVEFQSFTTPTSALISKNGETSLFAGASSDSDDIVVTRREATSSDGESVGMFVIAHRDTEGPGPVDLYGYGGFNINMTPVFNPARLAFARAGGRIVVTNLRGGTEKGERWHQAGRLGTKQQVFDDFIACAEHLIDAGLTTPAQLSISGRSNGGLLTAATMLQRPDLFGAVISHVPVTDMLRFQHFTAGRYWTVEYGDAADADAFEWLIAYSPLHNVDPDVDYPPTLVTTAEGDDRVVPMHSYKMVAELQHAAGGSSEQPLLLRVDTRAGHGMGKPTDKLIEEWADSYAFVLHHCGGKVD